MCPYSIKLSFTFRAAAKQICTNVFMAWVGVQYNYEMNVSNTTVHVVHLVANKENGKQGLEIEKESHPCLLLLADCPC